MNTQSVMKGKLKFMDNGSKRIGLYMGKDLLEACDNATEKTNATAENISLMMQSGFRKGKLCRELL